MGGMFNKKIKDENRIAILTGVAEMFGIANAESLFWSITK